MIGFLKQFGMWWMILSLVGLLGLIGGCVIDLHGNGEVGFKQATSWGFYHTTQIEDEKQHATSEIKSQPLLDYIAKDKAETPANP